MSLLWQCLHDSPCHSSPSISWQSLHSRLVLEKGYQCTPATCPAGGAGALGRVPHVLVVGVNREIGPVCFSTFAGTLSQAGSGPDTVAAQSPVFPPQKVFAITSVMPHALQLFAMCVGGQAMGLQVSV